MIYPNNFESKIGFTKSDGNHVENPEKQGSSEADIRRHSEQRRRFL